MTSTDRSGGTFGPVYCEHAGNATRACLFAIAAEHAADAVYICEHRGSDLDPVIIFANAAFEHMTGYRRKDILGISPLEIFYSAESASATLSVIRDAIKSTSQITVEATAQRRDGSEFIAEASFSPIFDASGVCTHWVSVRRDVTRHRREVQNRIERAVEEQQAAHEALAYLSFHDVLTGLPNRSLLLHRVAEDMQESRGGALLLFNLDRFGPVIDTFGRGAGDRILAEITSRLREACPGSAVLARGDGDTFMLWIRTLERADVEMVVDSLRQTIEQPVDAGNHQVSLPVSAGVVILAERDYVCAEEVLRDAEIAMHYSKMLGGRRCSIFRPEIQGVTSAQLLAELNLQHAIERDEFINHYQPIADLNTGRLLGMEALVRWSDPERGLVPPGLFIPIAERSGQVLAIGRRVLERACADAAQLRGMVRGSDLTVNVNVSPRQLSDTAFPDVVFESLAAAGLPPAALCLEVTETALAENVDVAVESLLRISKAGIKIAMDDFGTGYSSLGNLRRFPLTSLKIDRTFISGDADREDITDPDIVTMIVSLGAARGFPVIAEGIESERQWTQARSLGCAAAQGYFCGRPAPIGEVTARFTGAVTGRATAAAVENYF